MKRCILACLLCLLACAQKAQAEVTWSVIFNDPQGNYASHYQNISNGIVAAGRKWSRYLIGTNRMDIEVRFEEALGPNVDAYALNPSSWFIGSANGFSFYEVIVPHKIRTGVDRNGESADGIITIRPAYLIEIAWFDPDPHTRSTPIPPNKDDFLSLMLHEIGHLLCYAGWQDYTEGNALSYKSPFDLHVVQTNGNFYFMGAAAQAVYGGPVPLTFGNGTHVGNNAPRPGQDLTTDLMHPFHFYGTRLYISPLDAAMLADCRVPVRSFVPTQMQVNPQAASFTFSTEIGRTYDIQVSSDLMFWTTLRRVMSTNAVMPIVDAGTAGAAQRFYRVVAP